MKKVFLLMLIFLLGMTAVQASTFDDFKTTIYPQLEEKLINQTIPSKAQYLLSDDENVLIYIFNETPTGGNEEKGPVHIVYLKTVDNVITEIEYSNSLVNDKNSEDLSNPMVIYFFTYESFDKVYTAEDKVATFLEEKKAHNLEIQSSSAIKGMIFGVVTWVAKFFV